MSDTTTVDTTPDAPTSSKWMLIMRETEGLSPEALADIDFEEMIDTMSLYNESLIDAGVLVTMEGLAPAQESILLDFTQTPPIATDGPYGETKELFNGFWIIRTTTREEAVEWAGKAPLGPGMRLELRRVASIDEFDIENDHIRRERDWRAATGQL